MTYIIYGNPIPLARPRIGNRKAQRKMFDPQEEQRLVYGITLQKQHDTAPLFTGPISLECIFYMPIPKHFSEKKQNEYIQQPHHKRPDLTNMLKWVEDVATGIIFHDDAIIAHITAQKQYDKEPRTKIIITPQGT